MPQIGEYKNFGFALGKPGMIASHSYKHNRQSISDTIFVNKTANNFVFGTAALILNSSLGNADLASGVFMGVFQDNEKYSELLYYPPDSLVTVVTSGDVWVKVPTNITIAPFSDNVYYIPTAGATLGFFTNAATDNVQVQARFTTPNHNGLACLALAEWNV